MADHTGSVWFQESEMLYTYVMDTVITNCKEFFLDEGVPEDVLLDLKATWEHHVQSSHATENHPALALKANRQRAGLAQLDGMDSGDEDDSTDVPGANGNEDNGRNFDRPVNPAEEITSEDEEPGAEDPDVLMDTDNVLVCQYDKIVRAKNKFKMQLKSGIMTVNEKDYVFQKCSGEADW